MLDHFDGSFRANEKIWRLLPNVAEDQALFDKKAFYSERVKNLIGLEGIKEIHNIFKIGRNVKQAFHGNNPYKIGFDGVQHFASIPKNIEVNHSSFSNIIKNHPTIFCRGTYRTVNFGSDSFGFNPDYFPDVSGKKVEYCRDYILFTVEDTDDSDYFKQYRSDDFLNHLLGQKK